MAALRITSMCAPPQGALKAAAAEARCLPAALRNAEATLLRSTVSSDELVACGMPPLGRQAGPGRVK